MSKQIIDIITPSGTLTVAGPTVISGTLTSGAQTITGNVTLIGTTLNTGDVTTTGNETVSGTLTSGAHTVNGKLTVATGQVISGNLLQPPGGSIGVYTGQATSSTLGTQTQQGGLTTLYAYTNTSTPAVMGYDATGTASFATNPTGLFLVPSNSIIYAQGMLVCHRGVYASGGTDSPVGLLLEFMVGRGSAASTTQLIDTPIKTKKFGTTNVSITTTSAAISADTTNGAISITVTGEFGTPYYWTCFLNWVKV